MAHDPSSQSTHILQLPDELLEEILGAGLTGAQVVKAGHVCRRFREVALQETLWRKLCIQEGLWGTNKQPEKRLSMIKRMSSALRRSRSVDEETGLKDALVEQLQPPSKPFRELYFEKAREKHRKRLEAEARARREVAAARTRACYKFTKTFTLVLGIICMVVAGLAAFAFIGILGPRLDGTFTAAWYVSLTPLWIVYVCVSIALLCACVRYGWKRLRADKSLCNPKVFLPVFGLFLVGCFGAFSVLLALQVDLVLYLPWRYLFIPLFVGLSCVLLPLMVAGLGGCCAASKMRYKVLTSTAGLAAGVLYTQPYAVAFKLDGSVTASYWVVHLPLWIAFFLLVLGSCVFFLNKGHGRVSDCRPLAMLGAFLGYGLFFATCIMFTAKLEGDLNLTYTKCLSPVYALVFGSFSAGRLFK